MGWKQSQKMLAGRRTEKLRNFQDLPVSYFHTAFLSQIYLEFGVRHWGSSILFQDFPTLSYHSLMEKTVRE